MEEKIIKAGTILTIDSEWTEKVDDAVDNGIITVRDHEVWCSSMYQDWLPVKIEFFHHRTDRKHIFMAWRFWNNPKLADVAQFDLTIFKKLGYTVIEPEQEEIPLHLADDFLLTDEELVLKYLIKQSAADNKHRAWAEAVFQRVKSAMKEKGVIFYRP